MCVCVYISKLYLHCTGTQCARVSRHVSKTDNHSVNPVPGLALVDLKGPRLDIVKIHLGDATHGMA